MTTKELINQYVIAHAENRWMDASELEALLTEFAEKLKEPASEDLIDASNNYCLTIRKGYPRVKDETDLYICEAFKAGVVWQEEQMMKDAIEGKVVAVKTSMSDKLHTYPWIELEAQLAKNDKVKAIIIKE